MIHTRINEVRTVNARNGQFLLLPVTCHHFEIQLTRRDGDLRLRARVRTTTAQRDQIRQDGRVIDVIEDERCLVRACARRRVCYYKV